MTIEVTQNEDVLVLIGAINFTTVMQWREQCERILSTKAYPQFCINFSQIVQADTAMLSLMLCWLRLAKSLGIKVVFSDVPEHVLRMSELYGVTALLPLSS